MNKGSPTTHNGSGMQHKVRDQIMKTIIWIVILVCIGALAFPLYVRYKRHTCVHFSPALSPCMNNLGMLGVKIKMYAMDHEDHFPPTLDTLSSARTFCPTGRRDGKVGRYVYFKPQGRLSDLPEDTPIAADYPDNHRAGGHVRNTGGCVLHADGNVTWMGKDFATFVASNLSSDVTLDDNNLKWYQW